MLGLGQREATRPVSQTPVDSDPAVTCQGLFQQLTWVDTMVQKRPFVGSLTASIIRSPGQSGRVRWQSAGASWQSGRLTISAIKGVGTLITVSKLTPLTTSLVSAVSTVAVTDTTTLPRFVSCHPTPVHRWF
jgi:hypothetical protein